MGTRTLAEQVAQLEAERDKLRALASKWRELMELIGGNDTWQPMYIRTHYSMVFARPPGHPEDLPRIITAEDLREGQLVCIHRGHNWGLRAIGVFQKLSDSKITLKMGSGELFTESIKQHTIVLLADAPEPEGALTITVGEVRWDGPTGSGSLGGEVNTFSQSPQPVTAEDIRNSEPGSTWVTAGGTVFEWTGNILVPHTEDGGLHEAGTPNPDSIGGWPLTRSTAAPRGTYPKRLTVADLDAAEVGSVLKLSTGLPSTKHEDGWGSARVSARQLVVSNLGWSRATLTPPEKPALPTERGKHIRILSVKNDDARTPEEVVLIGDVWASLDGERDWWPDEITEWEPIRLIPEDGTS